MSRKRQKLRLAAGSNLGESNYFGLLRYPEAKREIVAGFEKTALFLHPGKVKRPAVAGGMDAIAATNSPGGPSKKYLLAR